jgi:cyclophilin family peptidyl-prolyl cis-trans isomerase
MRMLKRSRKAGPAGRIGSPGRIESLESRTLFNVTLTSAITPVTVMKDASPTTIDLTAHFNDPVIVGPAVVMHTSQGDIPLTLFKSQTPNTVTNFIDNYVNNGYYNGSVVHRAIAGYILQGGSYYSDQSQVPQSAPVPSEAGPSNTVGTIAAALTQAGPGSATSGWFINLGNNSSILDGTQNGGPFTVFGTVVYNGMSVVNQIANLPKGEVQPNLIPNFHDPGPVLPLQNWDGQTQDITPANYVTITGVQVVPDGLVFSATSDNPAVVVPTISNGVLSLNYQPGETGVATITVTATDLGVSLGSGHTVTSAFKVADGTVIGPGGARQIRFTDADGTRTTLALTGPGSASVQFNGSDITPSPISRAGVMTVTGTGLSIGSIALAGTSAASTLNVSGAGGNGLVEIGSITADGDVRAINASRGALSGDITTVGSVGRIQLASATGGTITINGTGGTLALVVGTATDEAVNSSEAIASVQSTSWAASAGAPSPAFAAPSVGRLTVRQELNANVTAGNVAAVNAGSITASSWDVSGALTSLTAGSMTGLSLSAGNIGRINARGVATNVTVDSAGNIASVSAQGLSGSRIEAGSPTLDSNGIPTAFAASGTLSTINVGRFGFSNSVIGAPSLGRVNLGATASANGGTPFGIAGHSIAMLLARVDGKRLSLRNVSSADQVDAALTAAGITLNDLVLRIV